MHSALKNDQCPAENPSATIGYAAHMFFDRCISPFIILVPHGTVHRRFVSSTFLFDAEATFLLLILGKCEFGVAKMI